MPLVGAVADSFDARSTREIGPVASRPPARLRVLQSTSSTHQSFSAAASAVPKFGSTDDTEGGVPALACARKAETGARCEMMLVVRKIPAVGASEK